MTNPAGAVRGRPRDPDIEDRVMDAALEIYSAKGWSGFTLDAVARAAGVGREALYRRWENKAVLLAQAVHARSPVLEELDAGSSRADLKALTWHFLDNYRQQIGIVGLRMVLDSRAEPALAEQFGALLDGERLARTRQVVQRAIGRGDVSKGTSVTTVVEILAGATLTHVLFAGTKPATKAGDERHVDRLVTLILGES
jgi:AcrR family transcriptional regulator